MEQMDEQLKGLSEQINTLHLKVKDIENNNLKKFFFIKRASRRLESLLTEFDNVLKKWLLKDNTEFRTLANENFSLLQREHIIYQTKTLPYKSVSKNTGYFKGSLLSDGYSNVYLTENNYRAYPLSKYDYVSKFLGSIDYLGNIVLKPIQISSSYNFSIPRQYIGYVNDKGIIKLKLAQKDLYLSTKPQIISQMQAYYFLEKQKQEQFFHNKKILLKIISKTKQQFLTNNY